MRPKREIWVQLATRVPRSLMHDVKVRCVERDVPVMTFVAEAIRERLRRVRGSTDREP